MKVLKVILLVAGLAVAVLVIMGLVHKKEMVVSANIDIAAPQAVVWDHVSSLEQQNEWSPWTKIDPEMTAEYSGESGKVGSVYHWVSNHENVGEGEQEITAIDPMNRVEQALRFIKPFESTADIHINVNEAEGGVNVEWGFESEFNFMSSIMDVFMDMEGSVEKDFQKGLASLKAMCEEAALNIEANPEEGRTGETFDVDGVAITEMEMTAKHYVGVRQLVEIDSDKMSEFMQSAYGAIMGALEGAGFEATGAPSSLYYDWNEETKTADMAAVIPVAEGTEIPNFESFTIPQGIAYVHDYHGAYDGLGNAHMAIGKAMEERGMELSNACVEEYITDPSTEADPANWLTKIYYPVMPASAAEEISVMSEEGSEEQ